MTRTFVLSLLSIAALSASPQPSAQQVDPRHPPLASSDIDDIATLLRLEDTRTFDGEALNRLAYSTHPEVRRRAVITAGRIVTDGSRTLVAQWRTEPKGLDIATLAFASGQLKDPAAVAWLEEVLRDPKNNIAAEPAFEAARALGKIRTPAAREALSRYLRSGVAGDETSGTIGEALLALGRFTDKGDLGPILQWRNAKEDGIRWRAAWALLRPRDPAAVPHLLKMADDSSAEVRSWAVRGLLPALVDQAGLDRKAVSAFLRLRVHDDDRHVRTEALRALLQYDDDGAFEEFLAALKSPDTWLSTSAAEFALRFQTRAEALRPALIAAGAPTQPLWLRQFVLTPLVTLAPEAAIDVASSMARENVGIARASAVQALGRLGEAGRARYDELVSNEALKAVLPALGGRGGGGGGGPRPPAPVRTEADYRRLVETWIVPDYNGAPKPHAIWETNRGTIELELFPGDAPMGVEYFMQSLRSGDIVGTEFLRIVPNFVDQQQTIRNAPTLRDEVNLRGLNRGTLAWASRGLDTGQPGYTLGITPQPHNEGDFTSLGRVISGMDVVEQMEWGDRIIAARLRSAAVATNKLQLTTNK